MRGVISVAVMLLLGGCAAQQALLKQTPSGHAEAVFIDQSVDEVRNVLSNACMDRGLFIEQSSIDQVTCSKTMEGSEAIFAQILIGNSYSTTPTKKVRFALSKQGDGVRVVGYQWMETQMAYGQMRQQELNANNQRNELQQALWALGAK